MQSNTFIDMTGRRVGYYTVIRRGTPVGAPTTKWLCRCDCGVERLVPGMTLRAGTARSCGCMRASYGTLGSRPKHGRAGSKVYKVWISMKQRCMNPRSQAYADYGGRGIKVCERWMAFENFLADMGERPPGGSLDRIDVNGHYEPGNCRWATDQEQQGNRRDAVLLEYEGLRMNIAGWSKRTGIDVNTLEARRRYGWPVERMLSEPVRPYRRTEAGVQP